MLLKLKNSVLLLCANTLISNCMANDEMVDVPQCPEAIMVSNNIPVVPNNWNASLASRYMEKPDKYKLKNGLHKTNSVAPMVSYLRNERAQKITHLSPSDETFSDTTETYTWYPDTQHDWVFYCDADSNIFLYKPIPAGVKKCTLTIQLDHHGNRSWDQQKLVCTK